jgi:hypothetical protein
VALEQGDEQRAARSGIPGVGLGHLREAGEELVCPRNQLLVPMRDDAHQLEGVGLDIHSREPPLFRVLAHFLNEI